MRFFVKVPAVKAGRRIGLSQPAVSASHRVLRTALKDELFSGGRAWNQRITPDH